MKSNRLLLILFLLLFLLFYLNAAPQVRIKDIAYFAGVRENQLLGIGLVTGLAGNGDSSNSQMLRDALSNLVANFGFDLSPDEIRSRNCAVVMVSAEIPAFVRPGDRIDINISSIGDARSLKGGILLQTPLKAANGEVYAVAQGRLTVTTAREGVKTVGTVTAGAIIEREVISTFIQGNTISIILRNPDFITAATVTRAISEKFQDIEIITRDASLIEITIPQERRNNVVGFIADIESITVTPDVVGKVVIDAKSGVIIMGEYVRISKVAVSYNDINVSVGGYYSSAAEDTKNFIIEETVSVETFVNTMKEIGLDTKAIISILKAIEKAGALHGQLIVM